MCTNQLLEEELPGGDFPIDQNTGSQRIGAKVTASLDESFAALSIDAEVLRSLGLVSVLDRLSGSKKPGLPTPAQDKAKGHGSADAYRNIVIYDIGGASVADPKH